MPLPIFDLQGPPIRVSGLIVGFDDPEIVGTWNITIQAETPLPAALPLFCIRPRRVRSARLAQEAEGRCYSPPDQNT